METVKDLNSILKRLKKLQKLYEGAKAINSEAEAQNAAAKIQAILTQYNLSMADLDGVAEERKSDITEDNSLTDKWQKKAGGSWDQLLLYSICKYNFCYCIVSSRQIGRMNRNGKYVYEKRSKYIVIGKKENIEVVKWLFDILARNLYEMGLKRFAEYQNDDTQAIYRVFTGEKKMHRGTFLRSYLAGAAHGVQMRLKEERDKELQAQVQVSALVLRSDKQLDDYVADKYPKLGRAKGMHIGSAYAANKGMQDGRKMTISKGGIDAGSSAGMLN